MRPALKNLDHRARLGIRGLHSARWLDANGYRASDAPNIAYAQPDGSLLARLSISDLVWLGTESQSITERTGIVEDYRCYTVSRRDSHAWFRLTGPQAPEMLAKVCAVDLGTDVFPNHSVAQTSAAGISAVIIRDDEGSPSFHLLCDSSYARYFQAALIDAGSDFGLSIDGR